MNASHTTTTAQADTIKSIAAIYIASAEAAENFINTRDQAEKDRHSELFRSASEKFKALIEEDSSLHDCELRELSYAITQHNFNDARARYAEIVKDTTEDTTTQENGMKKNTQAVLSVKMNDQFQINESVNYWNSQKSWMEILRDTGFIYKAEARDWEVKLVVHAKGDEKDTYGTVLLGDPSTKMIDLSESMMTKLNTGESSIDKEKFFAEQIFFGDMGKMLKEEIIPFYERHLRDLAAEESIEANKAA